ncbi:MAG TPA: response regulator [Gemmatimonadaceae bacterium]|nr:response regulator [Gemmatimonadaceae bacterium]
MSYFAEHRAVGEPHVLIVEDDTNAADALRILFTETGHRVSLAHSAARAVELAAADAPDLILLDLTLPDGDGLDVLDRLRTRGAHLGTVVALTGHDHPEVRQECRDAGCAEVLTKPVSIRELLGRAAGWIESGRKSRD